ncbi:hypothetical protein F7725_004642 [Dissostichus mawsoni]|uniref:Uncharacterized protein n=1 Tax=Dissostichus mawsoni TaxID=36200 RepID=A0A7J5XLZ8_DISMA|nr:hypothetical protein F7725_004642 [Dissostichus mawsoni]
MSSLSSDALDEAEATLQRDFDVANVELQEALAAPPDLDGLKEILFKAKNEANSREFRVDVSFIPGTSGTPNTKVRLVGYRENRVKAVSLAERKHHFLCAKMIDNPVGHCSASSAPSVWMRNRSEEEEERYRWERERNAERTSRRTLFDEIAADMNRASATMRNAARDQVELREEASGGRSGERERDGEEGWEERVEELHIGALHTDRAEDALSMRSGLFSIAPASDAFKFCRDDSPSLMIRISCTETNELHRQKEHRCLQISTGRHDQKRGMF